MLRLREEIIIIGDSSETPFHRRPHVPLHRESGKKLSSSETHRRPHFIEDPACHFIGDPNMLIGDPNIFTGDPNIIIGDPNMLIGDPNIFTGDPYILIGDTNILI